MPRGRRPPAPSCRRPPPRRPHHSAATPTRPPDPPPHFFLYHNHSSPHFHPSSSVLYHIIIISFTIQPLPGIDLFQHTSLYIFCSLYMSSYAPAISTIDIFVPFGYLFHAALTVHLTLSLTILLKWPSELLLPKCRLPLTSHVIIQTRSRSVVWESLGRLKLSCFVLHNYA